MTSKLVVNTIEADTGISSVSFASSISMSSTSKFHFGNAGIDIGADTNINRPASGVLGFNINSSEKLRITSDGKLLLGTDDTGFSGSYTTMTIGNASTQNTGLTIASSPSNGYSRLHFADGNSGTATYAGFIAYSHADDALLVGTNNSGTEKLRIASTGQLLLMSNTGYNPSSSLLSLATDASAAANMLSDSSSIYNHNNPAFIHVQNMNNTGDGQEAGIILHSKSSFGGAWAIYGKRTTSGFKSDLIFRGRSGSSSSAERLRITSDGKFGFNDTSPERTIDVKGSNCMIQLEGTGGNGRQYSLCSSDDTTGTAVDGGPSGTFAIYDDTAGSARLRINSTGIVNAPNQAGFYARLNSNKNDKTGDGSYYTVEWDTDSGSICYDQHNTFSTSTGLYQIPTGGDGVYQFATAVCLSTDVYGRQGEGWFLTNTGLRIFFDRRYFPSATGTITGFYGSCIAKMTAGQTIGVQIFVNGGSKNVDVFGAGAGDHISWFSGRKIA